MENELNVFKLDNLKEFFAYLGNNPYYQIKEINISGIVYEKDLRNKLFINILGIIKYFIKYFYE